MEEKAKLIQKKIEEKESTERLHVEGVRQLVQEFLLREKQFKMEDLQVTPQFKLMLSNGETTVTMDLIINLNSVSLMVIKCAYAAIESWERYTIAFARVIKDYQIPYAMITDGKNIKIIDVINRSVLGESFADLFTRQEALEIMEGFKKVPYPADKIDRERRIIYAFEGIKCPISKEKI